MSSEFRLFRVMEKSRNSAQSHSTEEKNRQNFLILFRTFPRKKKMLGLPFRTISQKRKILELRSEPLNKRNFKKKSFQTMMLLKYETSFCCCYFSCFIKPHFFAEFCYVPFRTLGWAIPRHREFRKEHFFPRNYENRSKSIPRKFLRT
jgi:hypothetical protein